MRPGHAFFVPADVRRAPTPLVPQNGTDFKFSELYPLLDCDTIQIVELPDASLMLIDEDGITHDKPWNRAASILLRTPILGDVVLCSPEMVL